MIIKFLSFVLIYFFILLEGRVTTIPLAVAIFLGAYILTRSLWLFPLAFVSGLFLDSMHLDPLFGRSIFFILLIFIVTLYEKKFEIQTLPFVFFSTFFASIFFSIIFGYSAPLLAALINALIVVGLFVILSYFNADKRNIEILD